MYIELADLFSHISFMHNIRTHRSFVPSAISDLNSLFVTARSRSTQWRRYPCNSLISPGSLSNVSMLL